MSSRVAAGAPKRAAVNTREVYATAWGPMDLAAGSGGRRAATGSAGAEAGRSGGHLSAFAILDGAAVGKGAFTALALPAIRVPRPDGAGDPDALGHRSGQIEVDLAELSRTVRPWISSGECTKAPACGEASAGPGFKESSELSIRTPCSLVRYWPGKSLRNG
jgi:hypothetical protein